jgi:AcrR family transcriptional regulator
MSRPDVSAARKPQILQAATAVFLKKGFHASRMNDIARQAGLSVGNLYRYFPAKLDITLELMRFFLEPSTQMLENLPGLPGSARQRLQQAFTQELEVETSAELTLYSEMYHLAHSEPRIRELLTRYNQRSQQAIAALLCQGIERGEIRPTDPDLIAFSLQAIFDGFMQNLHLLPEETSRAELIEKTFDAFFDGLTPD